MAKMRNGVYFLKTSAGGTSYATISTKEPSNWHQRLGHSSFGSLSIFFRSYGFRLNKDDLWWVMYAIEQNK